MEWGENGAAGGGALAAGWPGGAAVGAVAGCQLAGLFDVKQKTQLLQGAGGSIEAIEEQHAEHVQNMPRQSRSLVIMQNMHGAHGA